MAPADWTTADEIRRRTFSTAHEGYDREEVRAYLEGLAEWFVTLNTQMGNLRRAQPAVAPVPAQAAGSPGELAVRMAEILQDAEAHARQLHEAAETHHVVYRIVDGDDPDWASWYSEWLTTLSELPNLLGRKPVRSELTWMLVQLDRDYTQTKPDERWEEYYAVELVKHFA